MAGQLENVNLDIFNNLSVVVPFIGHDILWKDLLRDLQPLPAGCEILLVGPDAPDQELLKRASEKMIAKISYVKSEKGRARQLNAGARAAQGSYFWFLHADSKVPRPALFALATELRRNPLALHYFHLQFLSDGPKLVTLNSMAANWRSRYLGMPFGDQGFALGRSTFYRLGGFQEEASYGEDHLLVWAAHRKRILLNAVPASIFTSARRYEAEGWGALTSRRVLMTVKQAAREYVKLLKQRLVE